MVKNTMQFVFVFPIFFAFMLFFMSQTERHLKGQKTAGFDRKK